MAISGFNIDQFKSKGLSQGGARSSLFACEINFPFTTSAQLGPGGKFTYTCRAAEIPAMTIGTVEVPYFGHRIKIAGDRTFADWTATVMNDEDWAVRSAFEAWQNGINELVGNIRSASYVNEQPSGTDLSSYKQNVIITQYSKGGVQVAQYQLIGAYPTDLGAITLDWDNQNQIETFPVTLAYDYWIPVTVTAVNTIGNQGGGKVQATDYTGSIATNNND